MEHDRVAPRLAQPPRRRVPTDPPMCDSQRVESRRRRPSGQETCKFAHELDELHPITSAYGRSRSRRFMPRRTRRDHGCERAPRSGGWRPARADGDRERSGSVRADLVPGSAPLRSTGSPDPLRTRNLVSRPLLKSPMMADPLGAWDDVYRTRTPVVPRGNERVVAAQSSGPDPLNRRERAPPSERRFVARVDEFRLRSSSRQ